MKNAALAILASLAFHIALATLVAVMLAKRDSPGMETVRLDLSKMDFSISKEDNDAMPESTTPLPQTPARKTPPKPTAELPVEPPPAPSATARPDNPKSPEPEESHDAPEMTMPPAQPTPPVAPAPKQARIDAPPCPRSSIRPEYPAGARARGEQGEVTLEIAVDAEGGVLEVRVVSSSGFSALDDAAAKAARRATFLPAKSKGRPVTGRVRLTLDFRLRNR